MSLGGSGLGKGFESTNRLIVLLDQTQIGRQNTQVIRDSLGRQRAELAGDLVLSKLCVCFQAQMYF